MIVFWCWFWILSSYGRLDAESSISIFGNWVSKKFWKIFKKRKSIAQISSGAGYPQYELSNLKVDLLDLKSQMLPIFDSHIRGKESISFADLGEYVAPPAMDLSKTGA